MAALEMMKEIEKSAHGEPRHHAPNIRKRKPKAFDDCLNLLKGLENMCNAEWAHQWIVGLDLFGDELGYPYCPFVAQEFIQFIEKQREKTNILVSAFIAMKTSNLLLMIVQPTAFLLPICILSFVVYYFFNKNLNTVFVSVTV